MSDESIEQGTGNVFEDMNRPDAAEMLVKAQLTRQLKALMADHGLTQVKAAEMTGIPQPELSLLLRGRIRGFSIERLFRALTALGVDVHITLAEHAGNNEPGTVSIAPIDRLSA